MSMCAQLSTSTNSCMGEEVREGREERTGGRERERREGGEGGTEGGRGGREGKNLQSSCLELLIALF